MEKIAVVLFGAPGSGKGTQGELLCKRSDFKMYTMSSLIKKELSPESELYDKVINKGNLLEDEDVIEIFEKNFDKEEKVIIDGFPRRPGQAKWLLDFLLKEDYDVKFLYVKVDESKLLDRILLRAEKEGRKDDNAEVFENRLKVFGTDKDEILEIYKKYIIEINGDMTIDEVGREVKTKLGY